MRRLAPARFGCLVAASLLGPVAAVAQERRPVVVEPGDLTRRPDLIGRVIEVDDRLRLFLFHTGTGFDQVLLKRTPDVTFDLPPRLRKRQEPKVAAVKVRGVLRRDGDRWRVDVDSIDFLPSDLDRLNGALALLAKSDTEARSGWARWAEKRGKEFGDEPLLKRSREIEGEVIRSEAERPPTRDPADHWLKLADRARARRVAEPEPSALAHRGFRAALAAAGSAADLKTWSDRIEAFLPGSSRPPDGPADLSGWEKAYRNSPDDAYRKAPPADRRALDHALWADAAQKLLERRAADDPRSLLDLADEASRLLPDRPSVAGKFLQKGLEVAAADVGALRQSEVDKLAKLYRDSLHQPDKARALYRAWLDDQKERRISSRDAEGRIALAEQYESLLDDKATAAALLRAAWKIDPQSREVADAFRRRGFRKVKDEWADPRKTDRGPEPSTVAEPERGNEGGVGPERGRDTPAAGNAPRTSSDSLRNATPEMVRARFGGKPNRKNYLASQGRLIEQWVYVEPRKVHYINILHRIGESQARVVSFYTLDRATVDGLPSP